MNDAIRGQHQLALGRVWHLVRVQVTGIAQVGSKVGSQLTKQLNPEGRCAPVCGARTHPHRSDLCFLKLRSSLRLSPRVARIGYRPPRTATSFCPVRGGDSKLPLTASPPTPPRTPAGGFFRLSFVQTKSPGLTEATARDLRTLGHRGSALCQWTCSAIPSSHA